MMLKIGFSFVCRILCLKCLRASRCFLILQGVSLNPSLEKHFGLSTDVRSQSCCSCLDVNEFDL